MKKKNGITQIGGTVEVMEILVKKTIKDPWEDEINERARRIQQEKWSKEK